jgi:nitrosocyanin
MTNAFRKTTTMLIAAAALILPRAAAIVRAADASTPAAAAADEPGTVSATLVSVEVDETKFWLPGTVVVHQGDKVKLNLKNQVPGASNQHGFTIPAYNITEVVTRGTPKTISFVADKLGVFPFSCQLHPAHVGGQLVVLPK